MKIRSIIVALTASLVAPAAFGQSADVMTVVDESGSMGGEHAWIGGMILSLESGLAAAGVGTSGVDNQYSLTGFGGHISGQGPHAHVIDAVGDPNWGNAADYNVATGGLVTSGGFEDGWAGVESALNMGGQTAGAATNVILVTDEDRDNSSAAITFTTVFDALDASSALLNVVVNARFECGDGTQALGVDSAGNGYVADGSGGFTTCTGAASVGGFTDFGTTTEDYVNLAIATGGAAWDLNQLRAGGDIATSFTAAFVAIKVQEIEEQNDVPEPGTLALLGLGLFGLGAARRRRTQ